MAAETVLTLIGNATADAELRFTPNGIAVTQVNVASTPRIFDRATNEWRDGETLFMRCNIWRQAAENAVESIRKGTRLIVTGRLKQRSYETRDGEQRTVVEMEVDEIATSLRFATATVTKNSAGSGSARVMSIPAEDPWAAAASGGRELVGAGVGATDDSPPF